MLSELTGTHPETVRRYMTGSTPSVDFVVSLCTALDVSPDWLLFGSGPMDRRDAPASVLKACSIEMLLGELALHLRQFDERLASVEQTIARLEAHSAPP